MTHLAEFDEIQYREMTKEAEVFCLICMQLPDCNLLTHQYAIQWKHLMIHDMQIYLE